MDMTSEEVRQLLRQAVPDGGMSQWALRCGVTRQYVSQVLAGQAEPGPKIARALGLEKVVVYRPIEAAE